MIITKGLNFAFHTLLLNKSITVIGSVPDTQSYDADNDTYTPDYTLTPLTLQPLAAIIDKDHILQSGNVNAKLVNIRWYQIAGGIKTQITTDNTDFAITQSGDNSGRILIKKNIAPGSPVTLEFYAEYLDSRTGHIYAIQITKLIRCTNATLYIPILSLDTAAQVLYNPLRDQDIQIITASLRRGPDECPASLREFIWEAAGDDGSWHIVGQDIFDYCMSISSDGTQCTVDRSLMGDEIHVRCRAKYDIGGNPSSVGLSPSSPAAMTTIKRRIPRLNPPEIVMPYNIPTDATAIFPKLTIRDTLGIISNPEKTILVMWYVSANAEIPSYTQVANGISPKIPTDLIDTHNGGIVAADIKDQGAAGVMTDENGDLLADENGDLLIIK